MVNWNSKPCVAQLAYLAVEVARIMIGAKKSKCQSLAVRTCIPCQTTQDDGFAFPLVWCHSDKASCEEHCVHSQQTLE